ncbi:MAG: S1 RNA-binding domain-containing protein [Armatimonadota bacterium]
MIDIGSTIEGTIVKLAEYGAIVRLQGGKTGLIHISEIADTFVRDVRDFFKEEDHVRVKVLSINNKGRYELSTKQVEQPLITEPDLPKQLPLEQRKHTVRPKDAINLGPENFYDDQQKRNSNNFEDRLTHFIKESSDRQLDLKHNIDTKRGYKKR